MIAISRLQPLFVLGVMTSALTFVIGGIGVMRPSIYSPFTPESLLPGTISQDIVSLLAAFGLLGSMWTIRRGSWRAWMVWVALNGYLFYAYALYSFEQIYNPLYLGYIALTGLTLYSIIFFFAYLDRKAMQRVDHSRLPRRAIAGFMLALAALFTMVWMSLIIPGIQNQTPPDGASIFVLDLSFFLPLLVIIAAILFRGDPAGAFLTPIVLVKVGALGLSVMLGELLQPIRGVPVDPASVTLYALMGLGSAAFGLVALARIKLVAAQDSEQ